MIFGRGKNGILDSASGYERRALVIQMAGNSNRNSNLNRNTNNRYQNREIYEMIDDDDDQIYTRPARPARQQSRGGRNSRSSQSRSRKSTKELVLYRRLKAVFCMMLFAFAVVICIKVVQDLSSGNAIAKEKVSQENEMFDPKGDVYNDTDLDDDDTQDTEQKSSDKPQKAKSKDKDKEQEHKIEVIDGITYVDGILIANKTYALPEDYNPGLDPKAEAAFEQMAADAANEGIYLFICSGFRSYQTQMDLYNGYVYYYGEQTTDTFSAKPGHSEHQSGLAMDINDASDSFEGTPEANWLAKHCTEYGFIIRYKKGKESITGFKYEPWHLRYLGVETAKKVEKSGLCLEEYLGITSEYKEEEKAETVVD